MINRTLIYHELSIDSILQVMLQINSSCCCFPMFLYLCLEKTELKDDSSNDADWVRDLRFILIAAQKNYVLDASLGDRRIAGADAGVMNARYDDCLIVQCTMLYGLEPGLQKCF